MQAFICVNDAWLIGLFRAPSKKAKIGHMEWQNRNEPSGLDATATLTAPAMDEALADTTELVRELDHRVSGRIEVWLRWRTSDDLLFVEVADGRTGDWFVVEVAEGERPVDVFVHPYAYAAARRIDLCSEVES